MAIAQASTALGDKEQAVLKRVSRRYLWFLMLCLMINFVDRTNIGFAALTMNKALGLTATTFGLAGTALSVAYLLCEIPSNLILERVGARKWLARIMITWGIASAATMFATGPWSLAGLRALVGIAEAGFAPGLVLYMTYWYPQYRRAGAQTMFMLGQPLAGMLSATVGGFILGLNGAWGLAGWQWLFLLEGLPAIVFGIWMYFHLADKPKDAKFLSEDEKSTLINLLERDEEARRRSQPAGPKRSITRMILSRNMLLLSFAYACLIATVSAQGLWLPQIVRGFAGAGMPTWQIGLIVAIPPACSIAWMVYWTRRSDRQSERFWHCVIPMLVAAAGWATSGLASSPVVQLMRPDRRLGLQPLGLAGLLHDAIDHPAARGAGRRPRLPQHRRHRRIEPQPDHRRHVARRDRRLLGAAARRFRHLDPRRDPDDVRATRFADAKKRRASPRNRVTALV